MAAELRAGADQSSTSGLGSATDPSTARGGRLAYLDGLRALAFTLVFLFHTWEFAGRPHIPVVTPIIAQNTRPDFFVVLTGFLLMLPFARDPRRVDGFRPRLYLKRRLRRIVIPYYAALLFAVALPQALVLGVRLVGGSADWQPMPSVANWLWHLSFLHIFSAEYWAGINGSLWTMSLEMQLYLLFPLLIVLWYRWGLRGLAAALTVSLAYRFVAGLMASGQGFPVEFLVGANGLGRLAEFLAGAVCALWVFRVRRPGTPRGALALAVGVVAGYALAHSPWAVPWNSVRELGLGVAFASVIALTVRTPSVAKAFSFRPVAWMGYRSYSLFLLHQPLVWFFAEFLTKMLGVPDGIGKLLLLWTAGLGLTIVVGQVFFRTIEQPCIRWAKQVGTGPGPHAPAARTTGT